MFDAYRDIIVRSASKFGQRPLTSWCVPAFQVPRPQQLREADLCPQGLRHSRSRRPLLLLDLLQHRRRVPRQHRWVHHSRLLFAERLVQRQQGR
jgi:hypothetical protein